MRSRIPIGIRPLGLMLDCNHTRLTLEVMYIWIYVYLNKVAIWNWNIVTVAYKEWAGWRRWVGGVNGWIITGLTGLAKSHL